VADVRDTARRLRLASETPIKRLRRLRNALVGRHRKAAALFCGADGKPTPSANAWFAQLAADNHVFGGGFDPDPMVNAARSARRDLALEIIGSATLDGARLEHLRDLEREVDDE
jgi:hypothetical protein